MASALECLLMVRSPRKVGVSSGFTVLDSTATSFCLHLLLPGRAGRQLYEQPVAGDLILPVLAVLRRLPETGTGSEAACWAWRCFTVVG